MLRNDHNTYEFHKILLVYIMWYIYVLMLRILCMYTIVMNLYVFAV